MNVKLSLLSILWAITFSTVAQHARLPLNDFTRHNIQRLDILNDTADIYTGFRPFRFEEAFTADTSFSEYPVNKLTADNLDLIKSRYYFEADTSKHSVLNTFYTDPSNLYAVKSEGFRMTINPVMDVRAGLLQGGGTTYQNTRGAEIQGQLDGKIGFYTMVTENQAVFAPHADHYVKTYSAVPQQNFWKRFKENGYDFIDAQGHVNFGITKHASGEIGYGRHFIGNGKRSLLLSDNAGNYTYAKLETKVWKLHYTNLFGWMTGTVFTDGAGVPLGTRSFGKKFMALHHLQFKPHKNLTIGLMESIIFSQGDTLPNQSFDFNYLNPVIFYRSIEQNMGSDGRALVGMDVKWNLLQRFSFYGQFVLDEFNLTFIREKDGWWGNKYGVQLGGRYIDAFGLDMLDLQVEYNAVRPYTYTHVSPATNYAHFNQPLAHPLGANFQELLFGVRFQPHKKYWMNATAIFAEMGKGNDTLNVGQNILKDYGTRAQEENNRLLQGFRHRIFYVHLSATYMLKKYLFLDATLLYRSESSADREVADDVMSTLMPSLSLRWNIGQRRHEF